MPGSKLQGLGAQLKAARQSKGITLAEAQQATKIRQAFLQALEDENYAVLPPPVYIRGFLKNYASFLGLNPTQAVQTFDELMEAVAMGLDPYAPADSSTTGFTADGGVSISADGGADMRGPYVTIKAGDSAKSLTEPNHPVKSESLDDTAEVLILSDEAQPKPTAAANYYSNRSVTPPSPSRALVPMQSDMMSLRVPEKYVLKPAIQPLGRTSFYFPNLTPIIVVLIIVAAAILVVYRATAMPVKQENVQATPTANVFAAPTVTPLPEGTLGSSVIGSKSNPTITPMSAEDARNLAQAAGSPGAGATQPVQPAQPQQPAQPAPATTAPPPPAPTATPVPPTPTPPPPPVLVQITVTGDESWVQVWNSKGEQIFNKKLVTGEGVQFQDDKYIEVAFGKPGAVSLKAYGQPQTYEGSGKIRYFQADGKNGVR